MSPRKIAFEVLKGILKGSHRGGPILFEFREQFSRLDPKDSALTERMVKGILQKETLLEGLVKEIAGVSYRHLDRNLKILLKMGLYQLLFLDRVPDYAAINETVSLTRELLGAKASGYANWFLREAQRKKRELILKGQANGGILRQIPKWLTDHLREEIGPGQIERLLQREESPKIGLRVNTLKISREELLKRLRDMGTEAKASLLSPHGISLERHQLKNIKG
ncbi:MAG: transcription antitermination factor NusB, partial [Desulfatiglandales bacterium]